MTALAVAFALGTAFGAGIAVVLLWPWALTGLRLSVWLDGKRGRWR